MVRGDLPELRLSGIEGKTPGVPGEHPARIEAGGGGNTALAIASRLPTRAVISF